MSDSMQRSIVQRRGTMFRKQVRDPANPFLKVSITGASNAEVQGKADEIARLRRDVRQGFTSPAEASRYASRVAKGAVKVSEIWADYIATQKPEYRRVLNSVWKNRIAPFFAHRSVWELDELVMRKWWADELSGANGRRKVVEKTVANAWDGLYAAVTLAINGSRKLSEYPWGSFKPKKTQWTPEESPREACRSMSEMEDLLLVAKHHDEEIWKEGRFSDLMNRIGVMVLCGLRQGEGCALAWTDVLIDVPPYRVTIRHQAKDGWQTFHPEWDRPLYPTKGRKVHHLVPHEACVFMLRSQRELLQRHGRYREDGPVFPGRGGAWRTHAELVDCDDLRRVVAHAGLPNVDQWVTHSLRHSFATLEAASVFANGGDLASIAKRTRHSSISILEGYLHRLGRGVPGSALPALTAGITDNAGGERASELFAEQIRAQALELVGPRPPAELPAPTRAATVEEMALVRLAIERDVDGARIQRELDERKKAARERVRAKSADPSKTLDHVARAWFASGRSLDERPPEVTARADRAYDKTRVTALRAGFSAAEASLKGKRARAAIFAAYSKVKARFAREVAREATVQNDAAGESDDAITVAFEVIDAGEP